MTDYAAVFGDRALDAEVAEIVFGATVWHREGFGPGRQLWMTRYSPHRELPAFSSNRGAAMEVFFKCLERFGVASIDADMESYGREPGDIVSISFGFEDGHIWSDTGDLAPTMCSLAVEACRADDAWSLATPPR